MTVRAASLALVALLLMLPACGEKTAAVDLPAPTTPPSVPTPSGPATSASARPSGGSPVAPSPSTGAASSALDPCTLLQAAEVQQLVGIPVGPGVRSDDPANSDVLCSWPTTDNSATALEMTYGYLAAEQARYTFQCGGAAPLPGIGDAACFNPVDHSLHVLINGRQLTLFSVYLAARNDQPTLQAAYRPMAALAIPRLGAPAPSNGPTPALP